MEAGDDGVPIGKIFVVVQEHVYQSLSSFRQGVGPNSRESEVKVSV